MKAFRGVLTSSWIVCVVACNLFAAIGAAAADERETYFPPQAGAWDTISPAAAGFDPEKLSAALDFAMSRATSAIVVVVDGKLVAERQTPLAKNSPQWSPSYQRLVVGKNADGEVIEDVASMQKSVVSFLAIVAIAEGKLELDRPVSDYLGTGWSNADALEERKITVRHLMSMTSGLNDKLERLTDPDTTWRYNTGAYSKMVNVLEAVYEQPIDAITQAKLCEPIGMHDSRWVKRPWAASIDAANKIGFATSARDLARFGILVLNEGRWNDQTLLAKPSYLTVALSPSQTMNTNYGLLWWVNGQGWSKEPPLQSPDTTKLMVPAAPTQLVAARGALGRKIYLLRDWGLVVIRLGNNPGPDFDESFWQRLTDSRTAKD